MVVGAGCTQPSSTKAQSSDTAEISTSSRATVLAPPTLEWISSADGISYMEPETDHVWITLICAQGSGDIHIDEPLRDQPTGAIILVSGDVTESYAATMGRADEELGFPAGATAETSSSTPLMRRFRRTGELKFQGSRQMFVRTEGERQQMEAFFARCG